MNNENYNTRIPYYRSYQLLNDTIRLYNENIRYNNLHMMEYNRNMQTLICLLRESMQSTYIRRPTRDPPSIPIIRRPLDSAINARANDTFSTILRNYNPEVYTVPISVNNRNSNTNNDEHIPITRQRPRSRSLGEYVRTDNASASNSSRNNNSSSSDSESDTEINESIVNNNLISDISGNSIIRTFTSVPDATLSTSFHNASRSSISSLYNLLRRDFNDIMGFNNFIETTDQNTGLTEQEKDTGLLDISYNRELHELIDTKCPISLDDFQDGDNITQIVECGHIFKTQPIMTWFNQHTLCPKCRYNIRINNNPTIPTDVSFNVVTPLHNMNEDDIEREIDELTRRVTTSMIENINRNVEISINPITISRNTPRYGHRITNFIRNNTGNSNNDNVNNRSRSGLFSSSINVRNTNNSSSETD